MLKRKPIKPSKPAMIAAKAEADRLKNELDRAIAGCQEAIRFIAAGQGAAAKSMLQKVCDDHDDIAIAAEEKRNGMPALPLVLPEGEKLRRAQKRFDKMVEEYQIPIAMIGWIPSLTTPGAFNMTANGERRAIAMLQRFLDQKQILPDGEQPEEPPEEPVKPLILTDG